MPPNTISFDPVPIFQASMMFIASHAGMEYLYDQLEVALNKLNIIGSLSDEAVLFPAVLALDETQPQAEADASVARSGGSVRIHGAIRCSVHACVARADRCSTSPNH